MVETEPPVTPRLFFVPSLRVDRGMGHLRRCLSAAAGRPEAAVFYSNDPVFWSGKPVFDFKTVQALATEAGAVLVSVWPANKKIATVVVDLQASPVEAVRWFRERSERLVGWDEGGPARNRFPYLIDSLPHDTKPDPNVRLPELLDLAVPERPPRFDRSVKKILVVFGGADPAGLTLRVLRFFDRLKTQGRCPWEITLVRGPLSRFILPPGVRVLEAPSHLAQILDQWDLTITSWGITALESLAAGTPVLLLNPTGYHERLTRNARLPSFGVRNPRMDAFFSGLEDVHAAARDAFSRLLRPAISPGEYFSRFRGTDGSCPVCGTDGNVVFARTEHKSYHRCVACGMEYLSVHQLPDKVYAESYFFDDYQKQYGKTYLQDFGHIEALGKNRWSRIVPWISSAIQTPSVLDVGCAYGPFLSAAQSLGAQVYGIDIAGPAVDYVQQELGFPAVQASILDFSWSQSFPDKPRPDALTMWFVIEHFPRLDELLTKVNKTLAVGGVFAFSTPNGQGMTRTFRPHRFFLESPDDHFSIWNPQSAAKVLERFGFQVKQIVITGHHPERFPFWRKQEGWVFRGISRLSRWLGWGDTFEVYCVKTKELS